MYTTLLVNLALVVGGMLGLATVTIVGRSRLVRLRSHYWGRLRAIMPALAVLGGVLLMNRVVRTVGPELSWLIGWNVTGFIFGIEGTFVADLQSLANPAVTSYFAFVYVDGYVFLLVFPLIAYLALDEMGFLRETCLAYALNYGIGVICYVVFIAYGPRNLMPDMVGSLLYTTWPQSQLLTTQVNTNTNVFPSLHASLALTVAALAYRTREVYPKWFVVAAFLAASVVVSTMYLGIHWLLDVVAGGVLALVAVRWAPALAERLATSRRFAPLGGRAASLLGSSAQYLRAALNGLWSR